MCSVGNCLSIWECSATGILESFLLDLGRVLNLALLGTNALPCLKQSKFHESVKCFYHITLHIGNMRCSNDPY